MRPARMSSVPSNWNGEPSDRYAISSFWKPWFPVRETSGLSELAEPPPRCGQTLANRVDAVPRITFQRRQALQEVENRVVVRLHAGAHLPPRQRHGHGRM